MITSDDYVLRTYIEKIITKYGSIYLVYKCKNHSTE